MVDAKAVRNEVHSGPCSIFERVRVEKGSVEDYERLKRFHYKSKNEKDSAGLRVKDCYRLLHGDDLMGVIVYSKSYLNLKPRNLVFGERYVFTPGDLHKARLINDEIVRISRVVIHPKLRGIGLGEFLVRQTLPRVDAKVVEVLAIMAKYNPFFEKAGMTLVGKMELQQDQTNILKFLGETGGKLSLLHNKPLCKAYLNSLNQTQFQELGKRLERLIQGVGGISPGRMDGLKKMMEEGNIIEVLMDLLPVERVYLYWVNPSWQAQNRTPTPLDQASIHTDLSKPSETPQASSNPLS